MDGTSFLEIRPIATITQSKCLYRLVKWNSRSCSLFKIWVSWERIRSNKGNSSMVLLTVQLYRMYTRNKLETQKTVFPWNVWSSATWESEKFRKRYITNRKGPGSNTCLSFDSGVNGIFIEFFFLFLTCRVKHVSFCFP